MQDAQAVVDALQGPRETTTVDLVLFNLCRGAMLAFLANLAEQRLRRATADGLLPTADASSKSSRAERLMMLTEEGRPEPERTLLQRWMDSFVETFVTPMVQALTRSAPGPDLSHLARVPVACADKLVELCGDPPPVLAKCVLCANRHRKALREVCGEDLQPVCGV